MAEKYSCLTPIVLLLYHRPEITKQTLASIRQVSPRRIYLIADGPSSPQDALLCQQTRKFAESIDWKCEIIKIYSKKNLGLRRRVVTGLDEVFKYENTAIIIEDDCVADPSFFNFAEELLKKYQKNKQVTSIAGFNSHTVTNSSTSYVFSKYVESWGWATWKRAWSLYDDEMKDWDDLRETKWLNNYLGGLFLADHWQRIFDWTKELKMNSWAYRWEYSSWRANGLTAVPVNNLVRNIGFGTGATNTKLTISIPEVKPLKFPLKHPNKVEIDQKREDRVNRALLLNRHAIYMIIFDLIHKILYWRIKQSEI